MIKCKKGDNMNNKGFTLVELLATIVILGIVMGIASYGVISAINNSKIKSEKLFVDKIGTAIEGYLSIEGNRLVEIPDTTTEFQKCRSDQEDNSANCRTSELKELSTIHLKDITEINNNSRFKIKTINESDLVNPKNKKNCVIGDNNPEIRVFKDSEYKYYYYLDLTENTSCEISYENAVISNLIKNACNALKEGAYTEGMCDLRNENEE